MYLFRFGVGYADSLLKSNKKQKENKKKQFDTSDFIAADGGLYFLTKIRRTDTNRTEGQILEPGGKHRTFYYIYTVFPTLLNVTGQSPWRWESNHQNQCKFLTIEETFGRLRTGFMNFRTHIYSCRHGTRIRPYNSTLFERSKFSVFQNFTSCGYIILGENIYIHSYIFVFQITLHQFLFVSAIIICIAVAILVIQFNWFNGELFSFWQLALVVSILLTI